MRTRRCRRRASARRSSPPAVPHAGRGLRVFSPYLTASVEREEEEPGPGLAAKREAIIEQLLRRRRLARRSERAGSRGPRRPRPALAGPGGRSSAGSDLVQCARRARARRRQRVPRRALPASSSARRGRNTSWREVLDTMIRVGHPGGDRRRHRADQEVRAAKSTYGTTGLLLDRPPDPGLARAEALPKLEALCPRCPRR